MTPPNRRRSTLGVLAMALASLAVGVGAQNITPASPSPSPVADASPRPLRPGAGSLRWLEDYPTPDRQTESRWLTYDPIAPLDSAVVSTNDPAANVPHDGRVDSPFSKSYWKLVVLDARETFTAPARWDTAGWIKLSAVGAGIGVTFVFDEQVRAAVQRNRNKTTDDVFKAIEPFGEAYAAAVVAGFYVGGAIFKDDRAKAVALDGLAASLIASGLIDQPLKYVVGRSRPGEERGAYHFKPFGGKASFPSGHTTEAFAVASVIATHYDAWWVQASAYGLASGVGYARLNNDKHWASDVVTGAAIGAFVGHTVVRFNQQHRNMALAPILGPDLKGVMMAWSF